MNEPVPERALFTTAGVLPRSFLEVDNIDAAKRMVQEELGVALLPQSAVTMELRDQRLRAVRVADMTPVRRTIIAVRRRDAGARHRCSCPLPRAAGGSRPKKEHARQARV